MVCTVFVFGEALHLFCLFCQHGCQNMATATRTAWTVLFDNYTQGRWPLIPMAVAFLLVVPCRRFDQHFCRISFASVQSYDLPLFVLFTCFLDEDDVCSQSFSVSRYYWLNRKCHPEPFEESSGVWFQTRKKMCAAWESPKKFFFRILCTWAKTIKNACQKIVRFLEF